MEILKQGQFAPIPVEKQVLILYAGTNGYLDDLPVDRCRKFEEELYRFVENAHPQLFIDLKAKKDIDDALKAQITSVLTEFKQRFTSNKA